MNIFSCNRAKGLPGLAGLKRKIKNELIDLAGELLGGGQFPCLTLGTLGLQMIDLAKRTRSDLQGLAVRDEKVARESAKHPDQIRFRAEIRDIFGKNNFCVCHSSLTKKGKKS